MPSIIDDLGVHAKVQLLTLLVFTAFFYLAPGRSPCSPTGSKKGWMAQTYADTKLT